MGMKDFYVGMEVFNGSRSKKEDIAVAADDEDYIYSCLMINEI